MKHALALALAVSAALTGCGTPGLADELSDQSSLLAIAASRVLVYDNTFGGEGHRFSHVFIVDHMPDGRPLSDGDRAALEEALGSLSPVEFIADQDDFITEDLTPVVDGAAILTVGPVTIDGDEATVEMGMWCGGLCGIWLTYQAQKGQAGWEIVGTVGPIAVS